jgi:T-complex protein 1 subunit beta
LIKTTLGPCGLDKILQKVGPNDQSVSVTNDGATILQSIHIDNAAAKVLVDIAKVQDKVVGDGTTSVAVLAGELLREAESLVLGNSSSGGGTIQRIHPQTVCAGWQLARTAALQALEEAATQASSSTKDTETTRKELFQIATTTLSSKLLTHEKEHFANLAVDAVLRLAGSNNLDNIQIIKIYGGSLRDSYLEEGFILCKLPGVGQPLTISAKQGGARILLANTSMDTDKIKIYGSRVKVSSLDTISEIEQAEKEKMKQKVEKICNHKTTDKDGVENKVNCFINRQLIYNYPETLFTEAGIMAIEHADFDGMERLSAVLGGQIVSTFDTPESVVLGECKVIEQVSIIDVAPLIIPSISNPSLLQILIGEEKVMRFGGCKGGEACSIILRGSSSHVLDEAERSLHDALAILTSVVREPRTVFGGGCTEIAMAAAIDRAAELTPGKKSIAMSAFARALRQLPLTIADNGGYDAAELIAQLRAAHASGQKTSGLNMQNGSVGDMQALGIRESYQSKYHVVVSAAEAAEMIVRVDDIIKAAPRRRDERGY